MVVVVGGGGGLALTVSSQQAADLGRSSGRIERESNKNIAIELLDRSLITKTINKCGD